MELDAAVDDVKRGLGLKPTDPAPAGLVAELLSPEMRPAFWARQVERYLTRQEGELGLR